MLDKKTQYILKKMNGATADLVKKLVIHKPNMDKGIAEEMARDRSLSKESRAALRDALAKGAFDRGENVIDKDVEKKMHEVMDKQVSDAMRSGKLKPMDTRKDVFLKKHGLCD